MLSDLYDWLEHLSRLVPGLGLPARWLLHGSRKVFQTLRDFAPEVVRVDGTIGGYPVTIRVVGDPGFTTGWVSRLFDGVSLTPEARVAPFGLGAALRRWTREGAAVVVQATTWTSWFRRSLYDLVLPRHVSSVIKFGPGWPPAAGWTSTHRHLRGSHLVFRVTREASEVESFYRDMYVPTMLQRHGQRAAVMARTTVRLYAARGGLLLIHCRDFHSPALAGVVFEVRGSTAVAAVMGVAGGDPVLYRRGVGLGLYFYLLSWARQQGLRAVDLGGSPPILASTHLAYKSRWGAGMALARGAIFEEGLVLSREPVQKEAVCRFLGAARFVFVSGRGAEPGLSAVVCRPRSEARPGPDPWPREGLARLCVLDCPCPEPPAGSEGESPQEPAGCGGESPETHFRCGDPARVVASLAARL